MSAALQDLTARVDALETDLAAANGRIQTLESTLAGVIRDGDTLTFSGMNVQIVNGQGATPTTNGLGNLIVGYGEDHTGNACQPSSDDCRYKGDGTADVRTGSHNLVVGVDHAYTSYAGLLAGHDNTTSGASASVTGGRNNTASGNATSVSGGRSNTASDSWTSVSGGRDNTASNLATSVTGGFDNTALAEDASISGGWGNRMTGLPGGSGRRSGLRTRPTPRAAWAGSSYGVQLSGSSKLPGVPGNGLPLLSVVSSL